MNNHEPNRGLLYVEPTAKDYIQDGPVQLGGPMLRQDGQWDDFVPERELQAQYVETMACTSFGTLNCVEALECHEFGRVINWSDRFLAGISGTTQYGNDPHKVAETLRGKGCVYQDDWPYDETINTWGKFYQTPPYDLEVAAQAKFRGSYNFGHQWGKTDPDSMMDALHYSPLAVDVQAWPNPVNGIYKRRGGSNHWVCIYGYKKGLYWKCMDSYDNSKKKLAWDYGFSMVKQYTLHKQVLTDRTLWEKAIKWLRSVMGLP